MAWRLAGRAEDRIDQVVLDSARRWGIEAAGRYNRLIFAALGAIGDAPSLPGSRTVAGLPGVLSYHLRYARHLIPREHRVAQPRHLVLYRLADDGVVEVLGLVHDRQEIARAVRRAQREAGG